MTILNVAYGHDRASVVKNSLPKDQESWYIALASLNHGAGCENPLIKLAAQFAYAGFFCVVINCLCYLFTGRRVLCAYLFSMVAQAGLPSGRLVPSLASILTPVCVATNYHKYTLFTMVLDGFFLITNRRGYYHV